MNFNKLDNPTQLEAIPRRKIFGFIDKHTHHVSGSLVIEQAEDEAIVLCLIKNGMPYLEEFLEYYKSLGIRRFVFLDNGSTDETCEVLKKEEAVTLFKNDLPFRMYFAHFKPYMVQRFAQDRWALAVDIDEFFDYPFSSTLSLNSFLQYLNQNQFQVVVTPLLDMFSKDEIGANQEELSFRESHKYYSLSHVARERYHVDAVVSNPAIPFYVGGLRKQAFGLDRVYLTKHSLMRFQEPMEYDHDHWVSHARIADITGVLYHYKFLNHFPAYVRDAVKHGYHVRDSAEYGVYLQKLEDSKGLSLFGEGAKALGNVNQLIQEQFLIVSLAFLGYLEQHESSTTESKKDLLQFKDTLQEMIYLVTACDDAYAIPLGVMLFSLLENRNSDKGIEIYILTNDLSESHRSDLQVLVGAYAGVSIRFKKVKPDSFHHLKTSSSYISDVTYYRFSIPDILPEHASKAIYLDCDLIVEEDIISLWETDLKGKSCAGVREVYHQLVWHPWSQNLYRRLQIPKDQAYYNAGVLLLNIEKWRREKIAQSCIQFMLDFPEKVRLDDQDAMNYVLKDDWVDLPTHWNVTNTFKLFRYALKDKMEFGFYNQPAIEHYTGKKKPWHLPTPKEKNARFLSYWRKYPFGPFQSPRANEPIVEGISLICLCDNKVWLSKILNSYLSYTQIDEIILLDISGGTEVSPYVDRLENDALQYVHLPSTEKLSKGTLLNVGCKMSRRDKILIADTDVLIYDSFFEAHPLEAGQFYQMAFWKDWFTLQRSPHFCFWAYRQDLMDVNGFHEYLPDFETGTELFYRLAFAEVEACKINGDHLDKLGLERQETLRVEGFGGLELPPLDEKGQEALVLAACKAISKLLPWSLITPTAVFDVIQESTHRWQFISLPAEKEKLSQYPVKKIQASTIRFWLLDRYPKLEALKDWIEGESAENLLKAFFKPESIPLHLLLMPEIDREEVISLTDRQKGDLRQQLEAMEASYSWKIGNGIIRIAGLLLGWIPFVKKKMGD